MEELCLSDNWRHICYHPCPPFIPHEPSGNCRLDRGFRIYRVCDAQIPDGKGSKSDRGHSIALIVGALCNLIPEVVFLLTVIVDAFAVGVALFLMAITETEHPPAASTALGVAVSGISFDMVIAVLLSTILLSLIHMLFKKQLKSGLAKKD